MWIKAQNGRYLFDCVGFEIGYRNFGDSKMMGTTIYGISQNSSQEYSRVFLGMYEDVYASKVLGEIKEAILAKAPLYEMPKSSQGEV